MKTTAEVWVVLASLSIAACSIGDDNSPPVLSVELFWETERQSARTCAAAGVASMDFELLDERGDVIVREEDTERGHACRDGFDFPDLTLGDYTLMVTGYDANQNAAWSGNCPMRLDRFDRLYDCDVYKTDADTASSAEAGVGGSPVISDSRAAAGTGTGGTSGTGALSEAAGAAEPEATAAGSSALDAATGSAASAGTSGGSAIHVLTAPPANPNGAGSGGAPATPGS